MSTPVLPPLVQALIPNWQDAYKKPANPGGGTTIGGGLALAGTITGKRKPDGGYA